MWNAYKHLVENPGAPRHRKKDNTQVSIKETVCEDMDWSYMARNGAQWLAVQVNEPLGSIKDAEFLEELWDF
jgi:hypothetical protein